MIGATKREDKFAKEDIFRKELLEAVAVSSGVAEKEIFNQLVSIGQAAELNKRFYSQRGVVGASHGLKNQVVQTSKVDIFNAKTSQTEAAEESERKMKAAYDELLEMDLPKLVREGLVEMAAQEYAEAAFVRVGCLYIFAGEQVANLPTPEGLCITPQSWLGGGTDSVTELSKLLTDHLLLSDVSADEEFQQISKYVNYASGMCRFLSLFTGFPPNVVNATDARGQGLQSSLRRAQEAVYEWKRDLLKLKREKRSVK